jgi:hypothetical protein
MNEWSNDEQWGESGEQWQSPRYRPAYDHVLLWKHGDDVESTLLPAEVIPRSSPEKRARARFNELVSQWRKEIGHTSSVQKMVSNRAYLAIMLMAADDPRNQRMITRFILEELRDRGGHWYFALQVITRHTIGSRGDSLATVKAGWLQWGRTNGYLQS